MIVVNGMEYKTLSENLYANGKKVYEAYANGKLVYPDRENGNLLKIVGHVNEMVGHSHAGEDPSAEANSGEKYWYEGGGLYRAQGCFCAVFRSESFRPMGFSNGVSLIPAAHWPLNTTNEPVVFTYTWSTAPLLPSGDGIHPLLGSDALETHTVSHSGYSRQYMSAELLLWLNVSAPDICAFRADKTYVGLGAPYKDATGTPKKSSLTEVPQDVNGFRRFYAYHRDLYFGLSWEYTGPSGRTIEVRLAPRASSSNSNLTRYLRVMTSSGYKVPYTIAGTRNGVYSTVETEYTQRFNILNIPITDKIYYGKEGNCPIEHLHPRVEDLMPYL